MLETDFSSLVNNKLFEDFFVCVEGRSIINQSLNIRLDQIVGLLVQFFKSKQSMTLYCLHTEAELPPKTRWLAVTKSLVLVRGAR